jgi:hypothetical protein
MLRPLHVFVLARVSRFVRAADVCLALSFFAGLLNASSIGVAVNGTCEAGSCPPAALAFNSNANLSVDFAVTLTDGDEYVINGAFTGSNDGNGGGFLANHDFRVTYEGNAKGGASAADTIAVEGDYSFETTLATVLEGRGVIGSFGSTIAASSSASSCVNGTLACLGPFTPPGTFQQFSGAFYLNSVAGAFDYDPTWTANFGAGSAVGSYVLWGTTTPAPPPLTLTPEPAFLSPIGMLVLVVLGWRRSRRRLFDCLCERAN